MLPSLLSVSKHSRPFFSRFPYRSALVGRFDVVQVVCWWFKSFKSFGGGSSGSGVVRAQKIIANPKRTANTDGEHGRPETETNRNRNGHKQNKPDRITAGLSCFPCTAGAYSRCIRFNSALYSDSIYSPVTGTAGASISSPFVRYVSPFASCSTLTE